MRILKKQSWPYRVRRYSGDQIDQLEIWLGENMGCFKESWNVVYGAQCTDYYFRHHSDAVLFTLRWS